ncbi:hypothetical protein ONZ43_g5567 [Nemania bipapillata]|uniref:Uncharacterized protein n=1 Tax=Nemania bipapillata TaxID=110536 RepID=A0ACC2I909_9PEZI|nr:hypothetical protein ONZ43_g5567 [Nemania bipapillata]
MSVSLGAEHLAAAEALLPTLFSHLPQQHIPSSLRSQMLKTAILCRNKDAQVASILHPARDRSGRTPQVILPYLTQQFPRDENVEILRFNFRPMATGPSGEFMETDDAVNMDDDEDKQLESKTNGFSFGQGFDIPSSSAFAAPAPQLRAPSPIPMRSVEPIQTPFLAHPPETKTQPVSEIAVAEPPSIPTISLKRKNDDTTAEISLSKRVEIDAATFAPSGNTTEAATPPAPVGGAHGGENESSDDESVHLNMELDSDDEDEDDEDSDE